MAVRSPLSLSVALLVFMGCGSAEGLTDAQAFRDWIEEAHAAYEVPEGASPEEELKAAYPGLSVAEVKLLGEQLATAVLEGRVTRQEEREIQTLLLEKQGAQAAGIFEAVGQELKQKGYGDFPVWPPQTEEDGR